MSGQVLNTMSKNRVIICQFSANSPSTKCSNCVGSASSINTLSNNLAKSLAICKAMAGFSRFKRPSNPPRLDKALINLAKISARSNGAMAGAISSPSALCPSSSAIITQSSSSAPKARISGIISASPPFSSNNISRKSRQARWVGNKISTSLKWLLSNRFKLGKSRFKMLRANSRKKL